MPTRRTVPQVERRINFYRVSGGYDAAGLIRPINVEPALQHLDGLPFNEAGRYQEEDDGNIICCWIDQHRHPSCFSLGLIRRNDLPQLEEQGRLSALNIAPTVGLVELTHMVLFPDNILGAAFNFYGPRASRLKPYIIGKCSGQCSNILIEELMRPDVLAELDRLGDIRFINLRFHRAFADFISRADPSLSAAFKAAAEAAGAEEIEITLKAPRGARLTLTHRMLTTVRRIARLENLGEHVGRFVVKGKNRETEAIDTLDVLNDLLISKKTIMRQNQRTRALSSQDAYRAIREAYQELRDQLATAAGVTRT